MEENYQQLVCRPFHLGITGHRPEKLGGYNDYSNLSAPLKLKMRDFFLEKGVTTLVSGMALGVDQWAVEVALGMGIKVAAMIPCIDQQRLWPDLVQTRYANLLLSVREAGGFVFFVSLDKYSTGCMHRRNLEIINTSNEILAVWDGTKSGTKDCVKSALRAGTPVTVLNPHTLEFRNEVNLYHRLTSESDGSQSS